MAPATVAAVIERAAGAGRCAADLEITLEANPTSVEAGRFAGFRAAGVNRVSLGVQALDDAELRFLGREHSAAEALGRGRRWRRGIFPRFSFDLIYARPGQTARPGEPSLRRALATPRPPLALPADHRARHALPCAGQHGRASPIPTTSRPATSTS